MKSKTAVVLHNVRSSHNVGSVFRTADGAGVSEVVLVGYTPLPVDAFGKENGEIAKTALGAEGVVPWKSFVTIRSALRYLRAERYWIVSVEQDDRSIPPSRVRAKNRIAYILGNEVRGLSQSVLDSSDQIVELPMRGRKESLNVSVAAGVVLYRTLL